MKRFRFAWWRTALGFTALGLTAACANGSFQNNSDVAAAGGDAGPAATDARVSNADGAHPQGSADDAGSDVALSDPPAPSAVASIDVGFLHACALLSTGVVKCWGYNQYGALGDGTNVERFRPAPVQGLPGNLTAVTSGGYQTCARTATGGVLCWGANDFGELGDGTTAPHSLPAYVSGLRGDGANAMTSLDAGHRHVLALGANGGVLAWGVNVSGAIGDGTHPTSQPLPALPLGLSSGVAAVAAGGSHSCALTTAGGVRCWGYNPSGQVGDGTAGTDRLVPTNVEGLGSGVAEISAGEYHTCARTMAGAVKCWGSNLWGELGDGSTVNARSTPVTVAGLPATIASIAAGASFSCALTTSGSVFCWGINSSGELGDGSNASRRSPVAVSGLSSGVKSISARGNHACALLVTGDVMCWGSNSHGESGVAPPSAQNTPVAVLGL